MSRCYTTTFAGNNTGEYVPSSIFRIDDRLTNVRIALSDNDSSDGSYMLYEIFGDAIPDEGEWKEMAGMPTLSIADVAEYIVTLAPGFYRLYAVNETGTVDISIWGDRATCGQPDPLEVD